VTVPADYFHPSAQRCQIKSSRYLTNSTAEVLGELATNEDPSHAETSFWRPWTNEFIEGNRLAWANQNMVKTGRSKANVVCPIAFTGSEVSCCLSDNSVNAGDIFSCHFRANYLRDEGQIFPLPFT
jgi:hypothetical protein